MSSYQYKPFEYIAPVGLTKSEPRHNVVIIGAGPIGLALAIDLALRGIKTVVLDDNNVVSVGSRAICWAKRTLEIFNRLGIAERMLKKGVVWQIGRLFHQDDEIYQFDLLPESGHKFPAFVNLQQYYVEDFLIERAKEFPTLIDLRFKNKVTQHRDEGDFVTLFIDTPDGSYQLEADYMMACDGAGSASRERMGLSFDGQSFDEHFLIADVKMPTSPFNTNKAERWFWFEPTFHPGQSALLHQQPDDIYRIDLQLGPQTDPKTEATPEKVLPRIKQIMGKTPFSLEWMSVYKFRCAKLDRFVHNRVIFIGDSAHVVSPFGARGGNGGIHDVDNIGWKIAAIISGKAGPDLLDSYDEERGFGADENIGNSARATNFMTPKSSIEMLFRNETLKLAKDLAFARRLINSGRLSVPCHLGGMALQTDGPAPLSSGSALKDAPLRNNSAQDKTWLIDVIPSDFTLLSIGALQAPDIAGLARIGVNQTSVDYPCYQSADDSFTSRYGHDVIYLIRPDGHVAASFNSQDGDAIMVAYNKASGHKASGISSPKGVSS